MKKIVLFFLRLFSKIIVKKHRPVIVGITGSMGKTTTKDACIVILSRIMRTRGGWSSYNNEFGLPLTIIGMRSPGRSIAGWFAVFSKAFYLAFFGSKRYSQCLVLEMGADRPGDIDRLLKIVKPDIGILTSIGPVHLEKFKSIKGVLQEKQKLLKAVPKQGTSILNADDELVMSVFDKIQSDKITFGLNSGDLRAIEPRVMYASESPYWPVGMRFKLEWKGNLVPMAASGVLGLSVIRSIAGAVAAGVALGMNLVEIGRALEHFVPPPGRMRIISGIKGTCIIDDTYNSSPNAAKAALDAFKELKTQPDSEHWVVLGDMLDLGAESVSEHEKIGKYAAKLNFDHIITIGAYAKHISSGAIDSGFDEEKIYQFSDVDSAKTFVQEKIKKGDALLVKGSRAIHLEQLVEEIMAEPLKASSLLVK